MLFSRRHWLQGSSICSAAALSRIALSGEPPTVNNPRSTDGDDRLEPDWDERFSITDGNANADLVGKDDRVIQAAVDYAGRLGGGTVRILPGTYTLRASVVLPSKIRIVGSGPESVITRIPSEVVPLSADSDWYDQEITLAKMGSFRVGDSIVLQAKNPHDGGQTVIKRTIVAKSGNRLKLGDGLRENLWLSGKPTCGSLFPLLTSEYTTNVHIENLTLDGNRSNTENFNGNYGGYRYIQSLVVVDGRRNKFRSGR